MRRLSIAFLIMAVMLTKGNAQQQRYIDSIQSVLEKPGDSIGKFNLCGQLYGVFINRGKLDDARFYIERMVRIAAELKNDTLLMRSYQAMSVYLDFRTDSRQTIEYLLKALRIAEKKFSSNTPVIFIGLASANNDLENYRESLKYLRKADQILKSDLDSTNSWSIGGMYFQYAIAFLGAGELDSALHYVQKGEHWFLSKPYPMMQKAISIATAQIYEKLGNSMLAESYYRNSLDSTGQSQNYVDAYGHSEYSLFLLKQGRVDEAKHHAIKGLNAGRASQAKKPLLRSLEALQKVFNAMNRHDSAYYYATLQLAYRDTLFNQDKLNAIRDLAFNESIREKEEEAQRLEEAVQRKQNLQYAAIALGIIAIIIFFVLLSHSIVATQGFIRFLGIIALLIVFEFLNLLLHPWLGEITHHSPILMLLIMVCIAALLVPIHHKLEHWITHRLVEKNKRIRLAAARRTIEKLESP